MNKTYLILENDWQLSEQIGKYLREEKIGIFNSTKIFSANNGASSDTIAEAFTKHEILLFEPTLIEFSQYNLMMMLMYDLIKKEKLAIKEIHIFNHRQDIESDLKDLWDGMGSRKYLDEVIKKVKIFSIDAVEFTKKQIKL